MYSNINKVVLVLCLETGVTFVIIEDVGTINSIVGSVQISQTISLIMKTNLVSRNERNLDIYFAII